MISMIIMTLNLIISALSGKRFVKNELRLFSACIIEALLELVVLAILSDPTMK